MCEPLLHAVDATFIKKNFNKSEKAGTGPIKKIDIERFDHCKRDISLDLA